MTKYSSDSDSEGSPVKCRHKYSRRSKSRYNENVYKFILKIKFNFLNILFSKSNQVWKLNLKLCYI